MAEEIERPPEEIHRFLLSTTSRLVGTYESPGLRIDHAWPFRGAPHRIRQGLVEGSYSRNFFVLSVRIEAPQAKRVIIPDYSRVGDHVCALLSIFYGKRFDAHGLLVSHGDFHVPELVQAPPVNYFNAAPYSHQPRKDFCVPLELDRFGSVAALITEGPPDERFSQILFTAARFYLRSLRIFDQEPEFAYLDLVTCGECLANFYSYSSSQLLDEDMKATLERIRTGLEGGDKIVRQLEDRMRQVKRAYTIAILGLLTTKFFAESECPQEVVQLNRVDIEQRLKASYDLRSQYVHTGISFGDYMHPRISQMDEVQFGRPDLGNKKLEKAISLAPTYFGLERIMRYCLLRFIHLHGLPIDPSLDDDETNSE